MPVAIVTWYNFSAPHISLLEIFVVIVIMFVQKELQLHCTAALYTIRASTLSNNESAFVDIEWSGLPDSLKELVGLVVVTE